MVVPKTNQIYQKFLDIRILSRLDQRSQTPFLKDDIGNQITDLCIASRVKILCRNKILFSFSIASIFTKYSYFLFEWIKENVSFPAQPTAQRSPINHNLYQTNNSKTEQAYRRVGVWSWKLSPYIAEYALLRIVARKHNLYFVQSVVIVNESFSRRCDENIISLICGIEANQWCRKHHAKHGLQKSWCN